MLRIIKNIQVNQVFFQKKSLVKNFGAIDLTKAVLTLNKATYVGFSILYLSKIWL